MSVPSAAVARPAARPHGVVDELPPGREQAGTSGQPLCMIVVSACAGPAAAAAVVQCRIHDGVVFQTVLAALAGKGSAAVVKVEIADARDLAYRSGESLPGVEGSAGVSQLEQVVAGFLSPISRSTIARASPVSGMMCSTLFLARPASITSSRRGPLGLMSRTRVLANSARLSGSRVIRRRKSGRAPGSAVSRDPDSLYFVCRPDPGLRRWRWSLLEDRRVHFHRFVGRQPVVKAPDHAKAVPGGCRAITMHPNKPATVERFRSAGLRSVACISSSASRR